MIKKISDPIIKNNFKNVYDPSDDTYLIIDYFKENINNCNFDNLEFKTIKYILDMGTGTGIIAIFFLLLKNIYPEFNPKIYASDILKEAINCSKFNEKINQFEKEITFFKSDLFASFPNDLKHKFNIIVFNPPYLPSIKLGDIKNKVSIDYSWDGGINGIEITKKFINQVREFIDLNNKSYIYFISSSRADIKGLKKFVLDRGFKLRVLKKKHVFFEDILLNRLEII